MDENIAREILDELFSSLETLETRSAALLQFVKNKGLASEQELAPYFEQAANASSVRWRAARVRIEHLLASALKAADREAKKESPKAEGKNEQSSRQTESSAKTKGTNENEDGSQRKQKEAAREKLETGDVAPAAADSPNQQHDNRKNAKENVKDKTVQEKQNGSEKRTSNNVKESAA